MLSIFPDKKKNVFIYDLEENSKFTKSLSIEMEILSWLQQPCAEDIHDLSQLHQFPIMKKIFVKFNTPLTSSAPVERLFSFAGKILFVKCFCASHVFSIKSLNIIPFFQE